MERDEAALRQLNAFADTLTASYNAKVEMQEVMLKSQELMREVVWLGGGPHFQAASHGGAHDERGGGARSADRDAQLDGLLEEGAALNDNDASVSLLGGGGGAGARGGG